MSETTAAAGRTPVTLGTATPGGGFPVYGLAMWGQMWGQVLKYDIPAARRSAGAGEMSYFKT